MYSHVHGVAGAIIMVTCPDKVVGAVLAYTSHMVLDYLGETGYGDNTITGKIEFTHLATFGVLGFISGHFWLYFFGWLFGNLPDLIDKPLRIFFGKKEWHSCHNGPGLFQWKGKKLGYPVKIKFDRDDTIVLGILATLVLTVFTWIIK